MISQFKKSFQPTISIISYPFLSINPLLLTFLSLVCSAVFFFGITIHLYWLSVLFALGFIFDALDGYVARRQGKTSLFGAFLDSTSDRVSDFFLIASFGFAKLIPWELVILVLFTSFLISYIRARAESLFKDNNSFAKGFMQRTERIMFILTGFFLFLCFQRFQIIHFNIIEAIFLIIFVLNCLTILQRFLIIKNLPFT